MKKLMFAVAAIAAGAAVADVTSANVVGYQGLQLRQGHAAIGSSFIPVTGDTIDLTDITVIYDDETEEDVDIQMLNSKGGGVGGSNYYWNDFWDDEEYKHGWYNGSGIKAKKGDATYYIGDALWIGAPGTDFSIQYSGAVDKEGSVVTLRQGHKLVANPTPVAVNLALVKVNYDDETEEDVDIQKLNSKGGGVGGSNYYWNDFWDDEEYKHGWYNGSGIQLKETDGVMLQPGEALWIGSPDADFSIEFPGVKID